MKISIDEPATSLQQEIIENIEVNEVPILASILELLNLQHNYYQVHHYYTNKCNELVIFDRIRKDGTKMEMGTSRE